MKTLTAADLFCGAGGSSTGLTQVCEELGLKLNLVAVNHWDVAIQTLSPSTWRRRCAKRSSQAIRNEETTTADRKEDSWV